MDLSELMGELSTILNEQDESALSRYLPTLSRQINEDDWDAISQCMGQELAASIRATVTTVGKAEFIRRLRRLSKENSDKLEHAIKQSLRKVTSFQVRGLLGEKLIEFRNRASEQTRRSGLLAVALADKLTDLIFPAAERATKLADLIVKEKASPQAEKYLEEACFCYFYELYSASAVMCRSVLEEVVEGRMRRLRISPPNLGITGGGHTLGALLTIAQSPELRGANMIPHEAVHEVHAVNRFGSMAAHQNPLSEQDAWECLIAARHAITSLM